MLLKAQAGNTIVVAGGGGAGSGGSKGGGSKNGGNGDSKPKKDKGIGGSAIKLDDNTFYWVIGGALLLWGGIHVYQTNPGLIHGFIDPLTKIGQPAAAPLPPGQVSPQVTAPQTDYQQQQTPYQDTSMQGYPYGQGMGGSQAQYQSPGIQQQQPYQSMGQQYQQYPQEQQQPQLQYTQWNAANGQNSNSFAADVLNYEIDSETGELKLA